MQVSEAVIEILMEMKAAQFGPTLLGFWRTMLYVAEGLQHN